MISRKAKAARIAGLVKARRVLARKRREAKLNGSSNMDSIRQAVRDHVNRIVSDEIANALRSIGGAK